MNTKLRDLDGRLDHLAAPALDLAVLMARGERRVRQRMLAAVGASAAVVALVAVTTALATGGKERSVDPVKPTPSPTETFEAPAGQQTIEAHVHPGDVRGWKVLASMTNTQPQHRGATDLSTTVMVHTDAASGENDMRSYCRSADPSVWVYTFYGEGGAIQPCDSTTTELSPPGFLPMSTSQHFWEPMPARMYVTRVSPELAACARKAEEDCLATFGMPPVLADTDAEFGFRVYEHRAAPTVLRLFGYTYEALSIQDGQPWIVDRAVLSAPGVNRLAVRLPEAKHRWLVGLFEQRTSHEEACARRHGLDTYGEGERIPVEHARERTCGARLRLLVDGRFRAPRGDVGMEYGDPWMYAAAGTHEVTVDVTRGDPRNVRYAVIVWRARS